MVSRYKMKEICQLKTNGLQQLTNNQLSTSKKGFGKKDPLVDGETNSA